MKMGMETEWTFTKNGRNTVAQRTRMSFTDEEPSEEDREKMRRVVILLVKIAKRLRSEGYTVNEEFRQD